MIELKDGVYSTAATLGYAGDRPDPRREEIADLHLRRSIGLDVFEQMPLNQPVTFELRREVQIGRSGDEYWPSRKLAYFLHIRFARDMRQDFISRQRLMMPPVIHGPPKPVARRVKDWFKRTWAEVQRYDGPTGYEEE